MSSLLKEDWFPNDYVISCTENGSMTMEAMLLFTSHMNKFVRTTIPSSVSYCATIDGHSSRIRLGWIEQCIENEEELGQSPAKTSHFLQCCDADVNKKNESNIRDIQDVISNRVIVDMKAILRSEILG